MKKMEYCIILIMSGVYWSLVGSSNYSFSGQTEIIVGKALPKLKVHSLTFGCLSLSLSLSLSLKRLSFFTSMLTLFVCPFPLGRALMLDRKENAVVTCASRWVPTRATTSTTHPSTPDIS
ncbi:hypothetical protein VNO80_21179 [Phaseolus coccineus]|uniref:Uncharacterized protein n=1 Tax=Phaseolus coccineus TaxID=3886 RepID=A0AAN9QTU8_PHACN